MKYSPDHAFAHVTVHTVFSIDAPRRFGQDACAMVVLYALAAFLMTLAGGAFAFYYRKYLLYIMGFSAGILLGVVFFDVLPELLELAGTTGIHPRTLTTAVLCGFLAIFLMEKLTVIHGEKLHGSAGHRHNVGLIGAIGLSFHSFLDGVAIGVGFQAGTKIGILVLLAVLAHDFADGLNTVTFMLATKNSGFRIGALLLFNALAPVLGAALTLLLDIPPRWIAYQLAFFCGFLLYLGASDLLPEAHETPRGALILVTLAGLTAAAIMVFGVEQLAGAHLH